MNNGMYTGMTLEEERDLDYRAIQAIVKILVEKKNENERDRLKVVRGLKLIFNRYIPTRENVFEEDTRISSLFDKLVKMDKSHLTWYELNGNYIIVLLRLINYDQNYHDRVKVELTKYIKMGLRLHRTPRYFIIKNIWTTFQKNVIIWPDIAADIIPWSIVYIENQVFDWVNELGGDYEQSSIKYYAELSAGCKELFQVITAMLNKILCLTQGNESILNLISHFVNLVCEYCAKNETTIAKLYPKKYCRLISLLDIPPDMYFGTKSNIAEINGLKAKVLELLLNKFKDDQNMILMILTHYPKWLEEFFIYMSTAIKMRKNN